MTRRPSACTGALSGRLGSLDVHFGGTSHSCLVPRIIYISCLITHSYRFFLSSIFLPSTQYLVFHYLKFILFALSLISELFENFDNILPSKSIPQESHHCIALHKARLTYGTEET